MSSKTEEINIWVPAFVFLVLGSIVSCIWGCSWDLCRRRFWIFWARFFPWIPREVGLDQDINLPNNIVSNLPNRNVVEQGYLEVLQNLEESMRSPIVTEELRSSGFDQPGGHTILNEESASFSNVNTLGPTHDAIIEIHNYDSEGRESLMDSTSQYVEDNITFENSDTLFGHDEITIRSSNIESNLEHVDAAAPSTRSYNNEEVSNSGSPGFTCNNPLEPDYFPSAHMDSTPNSSSSSSSMFTATLYLPSSFSNSTLRHVKEKLHNIAHRKIRQWKSSVVLQVALSTHPVVLAKTVKLLKDCMEVNKSCTLQLGIWGILYFKGTSFTTLYTHIYSLL